MNHNKWYVINTVIGKEAEVVLQIKSQIPERIHLYEDIFVLKYENVWKKQGKSLIDIEDMFAGYVFVQTAYGQELEEKIQGMSELKEYLTENETTKQSLYEMNTEEIMFLKSLLNENKQGDYVVHRSFVRREDGKIAKAAGPLALYLKNICLADYKHRRVVIEQPLFGQVARVKLCIMTEEDCVNEGRVVPEI